MHGSIGGRWPVARPWRGGTSTQRETRGIEPTRPTCERATSGLPHHLPHRPTANIGNRQQSREKRATSRAPGWRHGAAGCQRPRALTTSRSVTTTSDPPVLRSSYDHVEPMQLQLLNEVCYEPRIGSSTTAIGQVPALLTVAPAKADGLHDSLVRPGIAEEPEARVGRVIDHDLPRLVARNLGLGSEAD